MVSYVIVHIGGGKKQRIQTTPSMILRQVVDTICKRRNDHHPERYILRKGNYDLDLSWTIHNAGITSGSQLDLIKRFRGTSAASSHFCIALQLGAMTNNSISLAASTSLRKALLVLEQATEGYRKSAQCTNQLLFSTSNNNNSSIFANRRSFSKSGREFPKYAPLPQRSFKSSTIAVSASFESGTETGVVRVAVPDMNAKLDKDHMMSDYDDNSDVNINEAPIAQPNNDKPLSGNVSIPTPYTVPAPSLTSRTGHVASVCRDGHLPSSGGGGGNGSDGESNRQTPTQDISAAMIEANQEIRQRLEQQTQEALTDRVRCLSKNSDSSSDKDRFLRSMRVDGNNPAKKNQQQDDIVRQIALRVSRMLKEAEERGETAPDYQTLIAQEIAKEQQGGMLAL
ncbi:hypothetical protein BGZ95_007291 [Linnemannia exigua]|uniref:TUG ubiquitin-like domain-containing protein n=1 Tax=Linnemannia exigua TaxID=604196 RepID=A0AAD4DFR3_9FUNG|nr:hypothetical protein BGZ95_007291 [Linnemannia exigua]